MADTATKMPKNTFGGNTAFLLTVLVFTLYWAWQTCVLYMPVMGAKSSQASSLWYAYNGFACIGYAVVTSIAPRLQKHLNSNISYAVAAACIFLATALELASSLLFFEDASLSTLLFVLENILIAMGGTLFTAMRFHLICRLENSLQRSTVLLLGTVFQLLLFTCLANLPAPVIVIALLIIPLALPIVISKANALLKPRDVSDDTGDSIDEAIQSGYGKDILFSDGRIKQEGEGDSARPKLPKIQLLAFFLLALSLNLIRSEIDFGLAENSLEPTNTIALAMVVVAVAAGIELFAKKWFDVIVSPFSVTALVSVAIFVTLFDTPLTLYAPAFSAAAFYLFVVLFWQNTARYCEGFPDQTVWVSSITHVVYILGLLIGAFAFRILGETGAAGAMAPLLFAAYTALIGAFFIFGKQSRTLDAAKRRGLMLSRQRSSGKNDLADLLRSDCLILAQNHDLTAREFEVLCALSTGRSIKAIADEQGVSENTVKSHVTHIYAKTGIHSREELMGVIFEIENNKHVSNGPDQKSPHVDADQPDQ